MTRPVLACKPQHPAVTPCCMCRCHCPAQVLPAHQQHVCAALYAPHDGTFHELMRSGRLDPSKTIEVGASSGVSMCEAARRAGQHHVAVTRRASCIPGGGSEDFSTLSCRCTRA